MVLWPTGVEQSVFSEVSLFSDVPLGGGSDWEGLHGTTWVSVEDRELVFLFMLLA